MTDTKFYSTTKSRLNRLGYKGFSKEDYVKVADSIGVVDLNNPTNEELTQAVNFLSQQRDKANSVLAPSDSGGEIEATEPQVILGPKISDEQVTPEEHQKPESGTLATQEQSQALTKAEANHLVTEAIKAAPTEIKQNLLIQYAEKEFQSVRDLLAFKEAVDGQIDDFLAVELRKHNDQRNARWRATQEQFTEQANQEVANRQSTFQNYLSNLQTRIGEFKL